MKVSNPVVRLHLVREPAHGGLRIRQWDTLDDIGPGVHELYAGPAELEGVTVTLAEGHGFWRSCTGCHETEDGHPVGSYAYSSVLQCSLGSGCSECGGLGATWDNTDYDQIAQQEGLNDAVEDVTDSDRLGFMLMDHRKVVCERLPHDNFEVYVEGGFMGDKRYPGVRYSGEREKGSPEALEIQREAIDAAILAGREQRGGEHA